jgi:hypothetical protein
MIFQDVLQEMKKWQLKHHVNNMYLLLMEDGTQKLNS